MAYQGFHFGGEAAFHGGSEAYGMQGLTKTAETYSLLLYTNKLTTPTRIKKIKNIITQSIIDLYI